MAEGSQPEDRTEAATPRRLLKAREEGRAPISREVQTLAGLAAVTLVIALAGGALAQDVANTLRVFLARAHDPNLVAGTGLRIAVIAFLRAAAPFILAALLAAVGGVLLQSGFLLHAGALAPQLARLSPSSGLRRLLGPDNLMDAAKSIAKLAITGVAVWQVLRADLPLLRLAPRWEPATLLRHTLPPMLHVLLAVLAVQAVIAVADAVWVRLRHLRQLRMTRQELRDEQKESEGDPKIKARFRQLRLHRARKRMLAAVPKATVVITNPTHYAVALAYDRSRNAAPRVVAKGVDAIAARIRETAQAHRVPLVSNPPLARALYRVELDTEIPAEHYQAVAEIIAYVWRLGQHARVAA